MRTQLDHQSLDLAVAAEAAPEAEVVEGHAVPQLKDICRNSVPPTQNQQQKLRVCEICAAFLSLYDNDRRLADHFGGRLHMGFIKVRERLEELQAQ